MNSAAMVSMKARGSPDDKPGGPRIVIGKIRTITIIVRTPKQGTD